MTSPASSGEPDSRTSSVGRKRGFNQFAAADDSVVAIEDDSSDEDNQPHEKRARYSGGEDVDDHQVNSTTESSPDIVVISDSPERAHSPQEEGSTASPEDVLMYRTGMADTPPTWNKGVPVTIRTSFAGRAPQLQLLSRKVGVDPQTSANPEVDTAAGSGSISKTTSTRPSLDDHEIKETAARNSSSEELSDTEPQKETKAERNQSGILAKLPSSFGPAAKQKEADQIIQSLPEPNRDLMPREVAKTALEFGEMGKTFKLPQKLHAHLFVVPLSKLCFRYPGSFSFVKWFLKGNRPLLGFMDYGLLVRAFREYLELLYGHLPKSLISIVASSNQVTGKKAELGCTRILNDAKKAEARKVARKEVKKAKAEMKNNVVLTQAESETPGPDSLTDLPNLSRQPYEKAEKSQNPEAFSMGRILGTKRTQSQVTRSRQAEGERKTVDKSSDDSLVMHPQEPDSKAMSSIVDISNQVAAEPTPTNDDTIEVELMHRYRPFTEQHHFVRYCLTCAQTGHETLECPSMSCATCGVRGIHFTDVCPKTQRCTKCHERGHQKSECPEKLAATAHESLCCDICKSSKHLESTCHFIWRSFRTGMLKTTKFVVDIPIHCYSCGATGHFGSECGIRHSPLYTEGYSWSISNWRRYVDPQSHNRALSAGKDFSFLPSTRGKKSFNIRGSAQNGTVTPKDDDENIPFIREKVTKPQRPIPRGNQHIKFNQSHQEDNNYISYPQLGPPVPDSRYQPPRAVRPIPQQKAYAEDRHEFSHRPRDDSARNMRERSFSPPPRLHEERYPPRPGDNYYRMDESFDRYRPYDRGIGGSNIQTRALEVRENHNQGQARGGPAQGGRGGPGGPRGKRQRNRKG
jgi:hypothetical protein